MEEKTYVPPSEFEVVDVSVGPMQKMAKGFFSELDAVEKEILQIEDAITNLMKAHNQNCATLMGIVKALIAKGIITEAELATYAADAEKELNAGREKMIQENTSKEK